MKKTISLILCLLFVTLLAACGKNAEKTASDAQSIGDSIVSGAESATDKVKSELDDKVKNDSSLDLMAGITAGDAKQAALKHAELDEAQVSDVEIDLDRDNGKLVYEVNFKHGQTEYDYEIDAETGDVISSNKDSN